MAIEHAKNYMHHQEKINEIIDHVNTEPTLEDYQKYRYQSFASGQYSLTASAGSRLEYFVIDNGGGFETVNGVVKIPRDGLYFIHCTWTAVSNQQDTNIVLNYYLDVDGNVRERRLNDTPQKEISGSISKMVYLEEGSLIRNLFYAGGIVDIESFADIYLIR